MILSGVRSVWTSRFEGSEVKNMKIRLFHIWATASVIAIFFVSLSWWDNSDTLHSSLSLVAAVTGMMYTMLAGRGLIICYLFGLINAPLYAYLSYRWGYYGDMALNLYYFAMMFPGILAWRRNLSSDPAVVGIVRTKLSARSRRVLIVAMAVATIFLSLILRTIGGNRPICDALTNVLSIAAMVLTIRRCIEQWVMWIAVDAIEIFMWWHTDEVSMALLAMWILFLVDGIYLLILWSQDLRRSKKPLAESIPIARALTVLMVLLMPVAAWACGPFFPVSYFPHVDDAQLYPPTMWVATNSTIKCVDAYRVTPQLGAELAIIGAHYYPAWIGKQPKENRVTTVQADELDFFAAGASVGAAKSQVEAEWRRFVDFSSSVCKRLENGERVELPPAIPEYAREFYLYKLGHAEWLVFRRDEDPAAFGKLLALPEAMRRYRTVWVYFVRIANARLFGDKDRHLSALRTALDSGFKDTAGLEAFVLRFLISTCGSRYEPLVVAAYAQAEWESCPSFAKRIMTKRRPTGNFDKRWLNKLCEDSVGIEVAIAYGAGSELSQLAIPPNQPALGADRQAWFAFNRGDFGLCRKLLAMAPERSLIRLFLEARLARLDGNYEVAGQILHVWLDEYRKKEHSGDSGITGYQVAVGDWNYWKASSKAASTYEPTLPRVVAGELGVVMVATRDLEEALYAFQLSKNWFDIAFVAERCMTVDELVKFMRDGRVEPDYVEDLRELLMRRLIRGCRLDEALTWAPAKLKDLCGEYCSLWREAHDTKVDSDERAIAFFNLSRLTLTRGMELMGTELRPDVTIYAGDYADDAFPLTEPVELLARLGSAEGASRWDGWKFSEKREHERFHYRRKAIEYAENAVSYAKDKDVLAWSLMLGGVASLSLQDVSTADRFYKRLVKQQHPRAKIEASWFLLSPVYVWFREEYYNKERHRQLRVPPRFTKDQFRQLKGDILH